MFDGVQNELVLVFNLSGRSHLNPTSVDVFPVEQVLIACNPAFVQLQSALQIISTLRQAKVQMGFGFQQSRQVLIGQRNRKQEQCQESHQGQGKKHQQPHDE